MTAGGQRASILQPESCDKHCMPKAKGPFDPFQTLASQGFTCLEICLQHLFSETGSPDKTLNADDHFQHRADEGHIDPILQPQT